MRGLSGFGILPAMLKVLPCEPGLRSISLQDCHFYLVNVNGFPLKHRMKIAQPNLDSESIPVPRDASVPACTTIPWRWTCQSDSRYEPLLFSQKHFNELVTFQRKSRTPCIEIARKQLAGDVLVSHSRKRNIALSTMIGPLYCCHITTLFQQSGEESIASEWRLKAVLLPNARMKPTLPVAHPVRLKECYGLFEVLPQCHSG